MGVVLICLLSAFYVVYHFIKNICLQRGGLFATLAEATFLDAMIYGLIASLAYVLYHSSYRQLIWSLVGIVTLLCITVHRFGFVPQEFKYPPEHLYILWGMCVYTTAILWLRRFPIKRLPTWIKFVSENSLWIYFWHLISIQMMHHYPNFFTPIVIDNWFVKWVVVVVFSCSVCYVWNKASLLIGCRIKKSFK